MAEYPFAFDIDVEGVTVAQTEGTATLGHDPGGSWLIESIALDGWGEYKIVPQGHYLYAPIMAWLQSEPQVRELDQCWAEHRRECKAERDGARAMA